MTVAAFAESQGLETAFDHGGNLHVAAPGQIGTAPQIVIGSRLDSVPVGGN